MRVAAKKDAEFVGSVSVTHSPQVGWPSPSWSFRAAASKLLVNQYLASHHSGTPFVARFAVNEAATVFA